MNKLITRRLKTMLVFLLIISSVSLAQFDKFDFLKSTASDAGKLVKAYVGPWANAFGAGLNGGWYNTAKPHKLGGFDITGNISVGMVPTSAETFDVSKVGLSTAISVTGNGTSPTIAGPNTNTNSPTLSYNTTVAGNTYTLASFKMPPGFTVKTIPAPIVQLGIGLPLGTEVKVRYLPKISFNKYGDVSLWGVGLMHSIMQYIPGNKLLPIDVSVFGAYTKLEANAKLTIAPSAVDATATPPVTWSYTTYNPTTSFNSQYLNLGVEAWNVNAIISANLRIITFYGGLGYSKTNTTVKFKGSFPTPALVATPTPHIEYNDAGVKKGSDFGNISIDNFSGLRANIGFRLKFGVFTMHADYTRAQYNVVSAGLGLSFR